MGDIRNAFDVAFRDYNTEGVPSSGAREPVKSEIRALGTAIEDAVDDAVDAAIEDTIANGETAKAPSQNAVFDALAAKADASATTAALAAKADASAVTSALAGKSDTSHTHSAATKTAAGFMSATDKDKLDGLVAGAGPLSMFRKVISNLRHIWTGPIWRNASTGRVFFVFSEGDRHEQSFGQLVLAWTDDGGDTIKTRTLWNSDTRDARFIGGGPMASGRVGILATTYEAGDTNLANFFFYCDGDPAVDAWTSRDITSETASNQLAFYGKLHPLPAGGNAFIQYGHGGSASIRYAKTTDNGATFTAAIAFTHANGCVEPSILKVGTGQYIASARGWSAGTVTSRPVVFAISSDMESWGSTAGAGVGLASTIGLGNNPAHMASKAATPSDVFLYIATRAGAEIIAGSNRQMMTRFDGAAVFAANGVVASFTTRTVNYGAKEFTGYFQDFEDTEGNLWAIAIDGETVPDAVPSGSNSANTQRGRLVLFTPFQPVGWTGAAILSIAPRKNLVRNPTFTNSVRALSGADQMPEGWRWEGSGSVLTPSWATLPDAVCMQHNVLSKRALNMTATADDFAGFAQIIGETAEDVARMANGVYTIQLLARGAPPLAAGAMNFGPQLYFDWGTSGSADESVTKTFTAVPLGGGVWKITATLATPRISGKTLTADATAKLKFFSDIAGSTGYANFQPLFVKMEEGDTPSAFEIPDFKRERDILDEWAERLEFRAFSNVGRSQAVLNNAHECEFYYRQKKRGGTMAATREGAAADFRINDYTIGSGTGNATAFTSIGQRSTVLRVSQSATTLTPGTPGYIDALANTSILIDSGVY